MAASAAAAADAGGLGGAFSDVGRMAANLGDLEEFKKELMPATSGDQSGGKAAPGSPTPKGGEKDKDKDLPSSGKKPKGGHGEKWWKRDEVIMSELAKHKTWMTTQQANFREQVKEMKKAKERVPQKIEDAVGAEIRLLMTRFRAAKLVLSECVEETSIAARVASASSSLAPPAFSDPFVDKTGQPLDLFAMSPAAENAVAETKGDGENKDAENPGGGTKDADDKPAEEKPAGAAGAPGEEPVAAGAPGEEQKGQPAVANSQKRVDDEKEKAADAQSTVQQFVTNAGGSATKALKKYIASFGEGGTKTELGSQAPCRSYRLLRCLSEFSEIEAKLLTVQSKPEIAVLQASWKPFKSALGELVTMCKAAVTRLDGAVDLALQEEHQEEARE